MKNLFLLLLLLSVWSSYGQTEKKKSVPLVNNPDKFFNINYDDLLNKKQVTGLSQLALAVEYLQLETTKDCIIGRTPKYFFTDSLIFISNTNHILKYSREGKFLKRIGNPGRGPGEIDYIRTMSVIPDKKLVVVQKNAENKLLYFSFDGNLVKTVSIPRIENLKVLNDGRFIAYQSGLTGFDKYNFQLTNENRDTISVVYNNDTWQNTSGKEVATDYPIFEPFYLYRNRYFLKSMYNDTVYYISSNKIIPGFFVNLGKYKLPLELRLEKIWLNSKQTELYFKKANEYFYCNVFEAADKIFLTTSNFKKRDIKYFLFDDNNKIGYFLTNENKESTGFINDWDGGPDFWPKGNINDNQVFMPFDILNFQKELEKLKTSKATIKFPEKQKQLLKIISETDATNNPILMIVTLKK